MELISEPDVRTGVRPGGAGYTWLALLGLWFLAPILNGYNSSAADPSIIPGWARPAGIGLFAASMVATLAWGAFLGRHQSADLRRWSLTAAAWVLASWSVLFEVSWIINSRNAEDSEPWLALAVVIVAGLLNLAAVVIALALGWTSSGHLKHAVRHGSSLT